MNGHTHCFCNLRPLPFHDVLHIIVYNRAFLVVPTSIGRMAPFLASMNAMGHQHSHSKWFNQPTPEPQHIHNSIQTSSTARRMWSIAGPDQREKDIYVQDKTTPAEYILYVFGADYPTPKYMYI